MKKELKLIVTFNTATQAMGAERLLRASGYGGRLVPIPADIEAGCGMAWMGEPDEKDKVEADLKDANIKWREMLVREV